MNRESIISLLGADWSAYEALVRETLHSDIDLLNSVNGTVLSNSGKQLRPMMGLLAARACGGRCTRDSIHYAVASELLHNATLMHDDVADNSSLRRGKPTLAALMGPTTAVLVGDYWLAKAVERIISTEHHEECTRLYAHTLSDLAEGEMLQLQKAERADTTEEDYLRIVYCKTASLFESACRAAALSVDASQERIDAIGRYGAATGIAFQIRDDIFDYWDAADIGKPSGIDLKEQKITMPLLGALRGCACESKMRQMVKDITEKPENCAELHSFVLQNGGVEYATGRLNDYVQEALDALQALSDSAEKEALAELARYNAIRQK